MKGVAAIVVAGVCLLAACTGEATVDDSASVKEPTAVPTPQPTEAATETPDVPETQAEPVPYIPAGQPGTAEDYRELVERLEQSVPAELRSQVPWPDLRNPDPAMVQVEIFELWIWMAANVPEPDLVEVMAAPASPSREEIAGVFGDMERRNELRTRTGQGYQAFDHVVVTFESSGLPLWLGRGVPEDAVVVYYSDNSGPVRVTDRATGQYVTDLPATQTRTWLSIMVPTNVGWQLWRDQLLEASNGLEVPDLPPVPGELEQERTPEL